MKDRENEFQQMVLFQIEKLLFHNLVCESKERLNWWIKHLWEDWVIQCQVWSSLSYARDLENEF